MLTDDERTMLNVAISHLTAIADGSAAQHGAEWMRAGIALDALRAIAAPRVAPSPTPGICAAIEQAAAWIELGEIGATPDGEALVATLRGFTRAPRVATVARPIAEWHEDHGPALWWQFPVDEPPYSGSPLDDDWPGYHTHWTPIVCPDDPASRGPIGEW